MIGEHTFSDHSASGLCWKVNPNSGADFLKKRKCRTCCMVQSDVTVIERSFCSTPATVIACRQEAMSVDVKLTGLSEESNATHTRFSSVPEPQSPVGLL